MDVRGCYTAVATAHMLGLDAQELAKKAALVEYVQRCQVRGLAPGCKSYGSCPTVVLAR